MLSQYRFGICLENVDTPGYLCEKMFDSFKAGCVPIYLGASNITELVPKDSFIDLRDFPNYDDLLTFIRSVDESRYNRYLTSARKFLNNRMSRNRWFEAGFARLVLAAVRSSINSQIYASSSS
ncbi:hypothetical protein HY468_01650 [Candidatus Roizmanbacteria bacterium]|nr:hypothetical protein [Candidatus Roizmanbacteria bacterium]